MSAEKNKKVRLVLLGGGHSNTQVIKHIRKKDVSDNIELILVSDYNTSLYSGMCPGGVANQYEESEFSVDLIPCCKQLEWTFICKTIIEINDKENILIATDGTKIKYDILSIDIGSTNLGLGKYEGINEYAISTRPLKLLMDKLNKSETNLLNKIKTEHTENENKQQDISLNVICVGGGCAGTELIMGIKHRLTTNIEKLITTNKLNINNINIKSTIITNSDQILYNDPKALQTSVLETLKSKNIDIITNHRVIKIDKNNIHLVENDKEYKMEYDIVIWSTGAAAHKLQTHSIAKDKYGWFKVNKYLQSISNTNIFGAGDCINIIDYGDDANFPPKAGVYAVREGPILIHNLKQCLNKNKEFMEYIPQTDFLRLLNTGDGKAIGCKHNIAFKGAWVWKLKDWIDVSWMNKFDAKQLLNEAQKHFKPKIKNNELKEEKDNEPIENAVRLLLINDEPNECNGFELQWKLLLKMNDDKKFCHEVVTLFQELTSNDSSKL
eukprot:219795_1